MSSFSSTTFSILKEFEANNTKEWFGAHKDEYETDVRDPFAAILHELTLSLASTKLPLRGSESTMFRVNRDTRFSMDKSPYNTHVSGVLTESGTKKESDGLMYLQISAEGGFSVVGLYHPSTESLEKLRNRMLEKPKEFASCINDLAANGLVLDDSEATKTMPRGFNDYAHHEFAPYIKLKNLMVRKDFTPGELQDENLVSHLTAFAVNSIPLMNFIHMGR